MKGIVEKGESDTAAAIREFEEETGWTAPRDNWVSLGETTMRSRKVVVAWAVLHDFRPEDLDPGTFEMHGRRYPEIDRVEWFKPEFARRKLNQAQGAFVERLESHLGLNGV